MQMLMLVTLIGAVLIVGDRVRVTKPSNKSTKPVKVSKSISTPAFDIRNIAGVNISTLKLIDHGDSNYRSHLAMLDNFRLDQVNDHVVQDVWQLPSQINHNPGMTEWFNQENFSNPVVVITYGRNVYPVKCRYKFMKTGGHWATINVNDSIIDYYSNNLPKAPGHKVLDVRLTPFKNIIILTGDNSRQPLIAAIFNIGAVVSHKWNLFEYLNSSSSITFANSNENADNDSVSRLHASPVTVTDHTTLRVQHPVEKLVFNSAFRAKNTVPFVYETINEKTNTKTSKFYSIYSGQPHIVTEVFLPQPNKDKAILTKLAYETVASDTIWRWGEIRGGSPARLIDTPYGQRYLTFFHSSNQTIFNNNLQWIGKTYYMGAYLFDAHPPFGITHISKVPIIPGDLYHKNRIFAFPKCDVIVFPTGYFIRNDTIFVSTGYQDTMAYIIAINQTSLLHGLRRVYSNTVTVTLRRG